MDSSRYAFPPLSPNSPSLTIAAAPLENSVEVRGEELICVKGSGIYTLQGVYGWELRKRIEVVDRQGFLVEGKTMGDWAI